PYDAILPGMSLSFRGHGIAPGGGMGYPFALLAYGGGAEGRTLALHRHQRQFRPYVAGRDGLIMTCTWGDRAREKKIGEKFMLDEIQAGAKLGADVIEIDD